MLNLKPRRAVCKRLIWQATPKGFGAGRGVGASAFAGPTARQGGGETGWNCAIGKSAGRPDLRIGVNHRLGVGVDVVGLRLRGAWLGMGPIGRMGRMRESEADGRTAVSARGYRADAG